MSRVGPSPIRDVFVVLALVVATNGPVIYFEQHLLQLSWSWEGPVIQPVLAAVALAAVAALFLDPMRPDGKRLVRPPQLTAWAIGALAAWMVLSSFWSLDPGVTRSRGLIYLGLAALAWIIADLDMDRLLRNLLVALVAVIVASGAALLLSDAIAFDRNDDWRGIFTNRNSLAPLCALMVIVAGGRAIEYRGARRLVSAAGALAAAVVMLGSGSRTAWMALAVALGAASVVTLTSRQRRASGATALRVGIGVGVAGVLAVAAVLVRFWDESTFSQRRSIWDLVLDRIVERPLHGYGWFNVWHNADFTAGHPLLGRGSAHGSILEVWLGTGLVGLVLFVGIVGVALARSGLDAWRRPSISTWTWLACISFLVIENLTESFVLWFSYNWVLIMSAALRPVGRSPAEPDPQRPVPTSAAIE